jgi:spore coat protein U-like protein
VLDTNVDATGGLGVTCTPGTAYTVGLNNGLTGTGPTARRMALGNQAVIHGLYKDAARSQPWGNSGGDLVTGAGSTQNLPVYGRVPPQATPPREPTRTRSL